MNSELCNVNDALCNQIHRVEFYRQFGTLAMHAIFVHEYHELVTKKHTHKVL
jgi:hypothetical protein